VPVTENPVPKLVKTIKHR